MQNIEEYFSPDSSMGFDFPILFDVLRAISAADRPEVCFPLNFSTDDSEKTLRDFIFG
jgi:hypothetical protein